MRHAFLTASACAVPLILAAAVTAQQQPPAQQQQPPAQQQQPPVQRQQPPTQQQPPPPAPITQTAPPPAPVLPTPPKVDPNAVAATVNGQPIMEMAVQRGLMSFPPDKHPVLRPDLVNFLIDNLLLDQYLTQQRVPVDPNASAAKLKQLYDDVAKQNMKPDEFMKRFMLSESELKMQIEAHLRWERFVESQANEKSLRDLFEGNRELFDGSTVRARHILLTPPAGDAKAFAESKIRLAGYKKQIEDTVVNGLAKEPPTADNLTRERARAKILEDSFTTIAAKESSCPSKQQGGDLGYFPRAGYMVEPFSRAAFQLRPYQMSDVVTTQFGHHLILVTDRKPGRDVKFEMVKDDVKEVFGDRLRDSLITQLRPASKIVVNAPPRQ